MKLTNLSGLPQTIVNLAQRDDYSRGNARISVTQLINAPKIVLLREKYDDQIAVDVTDQTWSLFGRAMHHVLERGADDEHIVEERLFTELEGWAVSGAIDIQRVVDRDLFGSPSAVDILDYKLTSAYSVIAARTGKPEWENQLNLYAWLVRRVKGWQVRQLQIVAFVRDWSRHMVGTKDGYPERNAVVVNIPLWSYEAQEAYVLERVKRHQEARLAWHWDDEPEPCTDEERWARDHKWAVKKPANKRASKVFDNEADAQAFIQANPGFEIEYRPGEPIRCTNNFCSVSQWCQQHQRWLAENTQNQGEGE